MDFLYNNSALIIGILIFLLSLLVGFFGERRMKNKPLDEKGVFFNKNESFNNHNLLDDESINNIF